MFVCEIVMQYPWLEFQARERTQRGLARQGGLRGDVVQHSTLERIFFVMGVENSSAFESGLQTHKSLYAKGKFFRNAKRTAAYTKTEGKSDTEKNRWSFCRIFIRDLPFRETCFSHNPVVCLPDA